MITLSLTGVFCTKGAEKPRWEAMDYGPYLTASIEAPEPHTNIAFKGIAINLGANFGGDQNEAVVFDTDLLRYSAGWTGDFVSLKGVAFDGEHWAYPSIKGDQVFGNPCNPGWARGGSFVDPREYRFGPLPREWAHWKGLYLDGKKVVLAYSVGATPVLEMPSIEKGNGITAFARTLNLGPATDANAVQLVSDAKRNFELLTLSGLDHAEADGAAGQCLAVLRGPVKGEGDVLALALVGGTSAMRWGFGDKGTVRLELPASREPVRCKVLIWRGPEQSLPAFAELARRAAPAADLDSLTHGGQARWPEKLVTHGVLGTNNAPYVIDSLTEPESNPWHPWMRFGGIDFFPDGKRAAVCTWNGDVWIISGVDGDLKDLTWQRIATGLFQPLGLQIVDGQIYVLGRDQITRLHDLNGDGEIDFYENFNNDCMTSEHFHEFALDLKLGPDGNFYYIKCACHGVPASHPHHGTLMRVSRDGSKLEVVARGFRAANGLGVGPHGEFTSIDNQGYWMPANRINWIRPGGWYGNQWAWNPDQRTNYDEPLCWMHNFVDRSGGTQLWVPNDKWGPFQDEIITLSYGMGHMFLLLKESVGGTMQGAVTRFPIELETGVMRGVFHPTNGQLYGCGLYGWAGNKTKSGGVYRIRYTGQPVHMARELHFVRDGLVLGFTDPLDPASAIDPGNYDVKAWNYRWSINYGSPDFKLNGQEGRDTWPVESAALSADGKRVFLKIPDLQKVMQVHVVFNLKEADGAGIQNFVHGTIHKPGEMSGMDILGAGAITRREEASYKLASEAPGLIQTFSSIDSQHQDRRVARLPALYVPSGIAPTPFLAHGRFHCRWQGFLKADLNEETTFRAEGRGDVTLSINGERVLAESAISPANATAQSARLHRGLNRFELEYVSPTIGPAELRLTWASKNLPEEPVPPMAFVHEANDPLLAESSAVREGRQLFAELRCAGCHQPATGWGTNAMPELSADAPSFQGIGSRLRSDWVAEWVLNPKQFRSDTHMPKLLSGSGATRDAADISAYLSSLTDPSEGPHHPERAVELAAAGEKSFNQLGCAGCHVVNGAVKITNDARLSLVGIASKWQPGGLVSFLRSPAKTFRWTRMPDFKLSEEEAAALAVYLFTQASAVLPKPAVVSHDAQGQERGRELVESAGCLGCHSLKGSKNRLKGLDMAQLAESNWTRGCMAGSPQSRGRAPDFDLNDFQLAALRAFARTAFPAALQSDNAEEFAERQYRALRCQACHSRDTQTDLLTQLSSVTPQSASAADDEAIGLGHSVHVGRPTLTFAGEKLYSGWMQQFLAGALTYKPRPDLQGRMPAFSSYAAGLAEGLAHEHGYPAENAPLPVPDGSLSAIGRRLTGVSEGFSCVSCHSAGAQPALAGKDTATVNFACVAERLRPSYYWRYIKDPPHVLPGTMMPKFIGDNGKTQVKSVFDGDPQRQFTAIWNYLLSLREANAGP